MLVLPEIYRLGSTRNYRPVRAAAILLASFSAMNAANYSSEKLTVEGLAVVRLSDAAHHTEVSIVPSIGNIAYEMKVNGTPVLFSPYQNLSDFRAKPALLGIPFLAPWANRLNQDGFYANGKKYALNPGLGNLRYDQFHQPIHGLITFASEWQVISTARRLRRRPGSEPSRVLEVPELDGAVPIRAYHRDDLPAFQRLAGSQDRDSKLVG